MLRRARPLRQIEAVDGVRGGVVRGHVVVAQGLCDLLAALFAFLRGGAGEVDQEALAANGATNVTGGVGSLAKYLHEIVLED